MASSTEVDFITSSPFWESEDGQKLYHFAQDLYPKMSEGTVLNLTATSDLLAFGQPNYGSFAIRNWLEAKLIVLAHPKPPLLNRRELIVAQLAKINFAPGEQSYPVVFDNLHQQLSGSGLEQHLGMRLQPAFMSRQASVSLEFPKDPCYYDMLSLTSKRIHQLAS